MEQLQYIRFKFEQKLGQRGAEMVEYAIVLACIAAVGVYFYMREGGSIKDNATGVTANHNGLNQKLFEIWKAFKTAIDKA